MRRFFGKLLKALAYAAATFVILLAVLVGLFRLFLPRLPEYQEDIKTWASEAIGMHVGFSGMNARWGLRGPELEFYDAELVGSDSERQAIAARRVAIGISITRLLFERRVEVNRLIINETSIEVRQLANGGWLIQGTLVEDVPGAEGGGPQRFGDIEIIGEDIEIRLLQPGDEEPRSFRVPRVEASIDSRRITVDAVIRPPGDLGREIDVAAIRLLGLAPDERSWDVTLEMDDMQLGGWAALHPLSRERLLRGTGDIDLSLAFGRGGIRNAAAEIDLKDLALVSDDGFDIAGRVELDMSADGWLAAAEDLVIRAGGHEWPKSWLRFETSTDSDGNIAMFNLRASYLNLADSALFLPLLPGEQRTRLEAFAPSGEVRELVATVSDLQGGAPEYAIAADLENVGIAASGKRPGLRGFTGQVRADNSGGRLEIRSDDILLELPQHMDDAADITSAEGTVLWRASGKRITILSDSIRIVNPVLDSRINVQLSIGADGSEPVIDLVSTFSISDVGEARRYLPRKIMTEKLYSWFQGALVAGSIERGTARLKGPLDKFPFEKGEGRLLIEGSVRNMTFKYEPKWPAAEQTDMEVVLDNTRLYTVRNRAVTAGNLVVDANVEIANLRQPVLTIDGLVTGTLESLRQFALQSPIDGFTGGNLSRLSVSGDASFKLDLTVPLKHAVDTTLNGVLRSNNGTLVVDGLAAPVTDLIGEVLITRDQVTGDSLGGQFLGEEVRFRIGQPQDERFFAVATATGTATAAAIVDELGVPVAGLLEGSAPYEARILFPRGNEEEPVPFTVRIASPLRGMALHLPDPVGKPADEAMLIRGDILFMPGGERIESDGLAGNGIAWQLAFTRQEGEWDFDRGVLTSGGGAVEPAETRGLHLRGRTTTVRLDEWLNLSRSDEEKIGAAERIRSVDLVVDDLFAVGQHLEGHRVRLDRSAQDWLVQIEGEDVLGSVFVPYDFGSERPMVVDMERLLLPGDDVSPPSESDIDPRKLPPIQLRADDFALGERRFGAVDVDLVRTEDGLESKRLDATDPSFEFVGSASWVADASEPRGSRTYLRGGLTSKDVAATLTRLNVAQGVTGDTMGIDFDLNWGGGPRADFFDAVDGTIQLRLEKGQLEEVEPGAGRMLGLMSFVALPRRLSLDFRDVFSKGFRYDKIAGRFTVEKGIASTCDMSLEGPAAQIGIVGQVDLPAEVYQQAVVVSAQVGNTLPIVGAVVGGPPAAAAMLIFSQIFKKPLQEVGQVYYGITGPWAEPTIEAIKADGFVRYGELAGCLAGKQEQE